MDRSNALRRLVCALLLVAPTAMAQVTAAKPGWRETIVVAAASDLRFALEEIVGAFEKQKPGLKVQVTYGSSGNFYSQITQGAPFDLFLSADALYPNRLMESGLAVTNTRFTYGVGRIVVWFPSNSTVNVASLGIRSLLEPSVRRIAIANPEHAPYGRAAIAALKSLGVHDAVKERLVHGENVSQAAQFVESGAADAGIIALSLALAPKMKDRGQLWAVPIEAYPRLEQVGVILKRAEGSGAARAFRLFLMGADGRSILGRYGFASDNQ